MSGVFANGLEISGKAVNAKTIAAMPDVCFTPPENPATPPGVPVPYPSFGMASDAENGTGTVFIGGKTVNIKNKSDEFEDLRHRGRRRCQEGRHHLEEHRKEVLQFLVERREIRRRAGDPVHRPCHA